MQVGMIGLGRMGANMVRRLLRRGHPCVVYDRDPDAVDRLAAEGAQGVRSLDDLARALRPRRAAWLMLPAGPPTEETIAALAERLAPEDVLVDGGNSHYKDDVRRAQALKARGIHYVDVGTSGGIWGLERGYCLMIGGEAAAVQFLDPLFRALAPGRGAAPRTPGREPTGGTAEEGYLHCGSAGAGHFVKMVHNGIEYGMMQAYAEGFDILRNAGAEVAPPERRSELALADIAEVWRRGSVIGSWLLDLAAGALLEDPALARYSGFVQDSGEGRWTIMAALEAAVPCPVLSMALFTRFRSRQEHPYGERVLSALRHAFGGHLERPTGG